MESPRIARIGFPVKVLGAQELKSNDSRRWKNKPHLKISLGYLDRIFDYLAENKIRMYRMSSDLAPYTTHPEMPEFHGMITESQFELAQIGRKAKSLDLRLSFHPSQYIVLNSPDPVLVEKSVADIQAQSEILDLMGMGPEAVVVIHVGGAYGDRASGRKRWVETWNRLPDYVKNRLVLENDDLRFGPADTLWIHEQTGVRLIFDYQHFWCFNPEGLELAPTVRKMLQSWPNGVMPKVHFSSPKTELRPTETKKDGKKLVSYAKPIWTNHADYVNPFEFAAFIRTVPDLHFDVMLESKAKDVALLQLRQDLLRYVPDVAARFS